MKFSYTILPEQRLYVLRFRGSISVKDVTAAAHDIWADPRYSPSYNGIASFEGVTTRARLKDVRALLSFLEDRSRGFGNWAAIFTEPRPTALALMFKAAFAGSFQLEIVSSWDAACRFVQSEIPPTVV